MINLKDYIIENGNNSINELSQLTGKKPNDIQSTQKTFAYLAQMAGQEINAENYAKCVISLCDVKDDEKKDQIKSIITDDFDSFKKEIEHWSEYFKYNDPND